MRAEICHINLSNEFRGGERQTGLLISALAERGWPQRAIVRHSSPLARQLRGITGLRVVEKSGNLLSAALFGGRSDVIHVHQGRSLHVAGLQHLVRRRPYIVTRRVNNPVRPTLANRLGYGNAACVVTLTRAIAASVNAFDPSIDCQVIPSSPARLRHSPQASAQLKRRTGKQFLVGHVGELDDATKGQLQLIEAARVLQRELPDIGFVLVGSGKDEARLQAAAEGLDNVFFAGQVTNVGDYFAAFDVFAFPSRREGLGSSILDAYQFGLPVVAARTGGIPEVVTNEVNGMLFDLDDISALVAALRCYHHDEALRSEVGARNANAAKRYAPEVIATEYERIYQHVLEGTASR